ncbi:MAG: Rrf2 family transcriptional regulator [Bacteroidia bacterium]|nr:Rrf2 family transcriptional regulator [Bacteroidia bacterium]
MLSSSSQYAVRAALYLAMKTSESEKMKAEDIAKALDIPKHFLAKILQQLTRKKIVSSTKGRNGGFYLSDNNRSCSLLEVLEAIDGPMSLNSCILGLKNCSDAYPCPYHNQVSKFRFSFYNQLMTESIDSCLQRIDFSKLRITNPDKQKLTSSGDR